MSVKIAIVKHAIPNQNLRNILFFAMLILTLVTPIFFLQNVLSNRGLFISQGITAVIFFILLEKVVGAYSIIGEIKISDEKLIVNQETDNKEITFSNIKQIELKPDVGISKFKETFTSYTCHIIREDSVEHCYDISRGAIINGKLKTRNILHQKRFDLFAFLSQKRIPYKFVRHIKMED